MNPTTRSVPAVWKVLSIVSLAVAAAGWLARPAVAQRAGTSATLKGQVTAQGAEVRALRVKATDSAHKIAYTVFTQKGQYQIFNLPPGTYSVQVMEEAWQSAAQSVSVAAGETKTADVQVTPRVKPQREEAEKLDFEALYPPGPGRDLLVKHCLSCHGLPVEGAFRSYSGLNIRGMTEAGWRAAYTQKMLGKYYGKQLPVIPHDRLTTEEQDTIIKYLATNFPVKGPRRDLKFDTLVRDEGALARAVFIEYEVPPRAGGEVAVDKDTPGIIWFSGGRNNLLRFDTRNLDPATRTKLFPFDDAPAGEGESIAVHGLITLKGGRLWWTEYYTAKVDELDVKTGKVQKYPTKTGGAPHSIAADSKGNIYWTYISGVGKIGRVDAKTRVSADIDLPVKNLNAYGISVDAQDRVWVGAPSFSSNVFMYDPRSAAWKTYPVSTAARRVTTDSTGKVWFGLYYGNVVAMADPERGKVTEHTLPLKYGNPYGINVDTHDNLWLDNSNYNALVKFDQRTSKFLYVPYPSIDTHASHFDGDADGTMWYFTSSTPGHGEAPPTEFADNTRSVAKMRPGGLSTLVGFKLEGNVPVKGASQ